MRNTKRFNYIRIIAWAAVICWMFLIFYMSAQPGHQSDQLSKGFAATILRAVEKIFSQTDIDMSKFNYFIRKNAHFFSYLLLGMLAAYAVRKVSSHSFWRRAVYALGLCVLFAISDELHQLYVPGRSARVFDVMIDSAGATVGIALTMAWQRWRKPRQK
ncbi:VanZ family protein [Paenibacillaceae bacterium]|nr:VanZ family protein [Paenibacillaceae bacterium]